MRLSTLSDYCCGVQQRQITALLEWRIHVTTVMAEHDKNVENPKYSSRDGKEINPGYTVGMVFKKRAPGLGRLITVSNHVLCNSGLGYLDAKHFQFTVDAGRAPTNIVP
jgi:hypothetical protein